MAPAPAPSAHAGRNPGRAVQLARSRKKGQPLSDVQKRNRADKALSRKLQDENMVADIEAFHAMRANLTLELANKYSRPADSIRKLLNNASVYKQTRDVSLRSAVMHDISVKGREDGESLHVTELHKLADEILSAGVTPEEEARMKEALRESRQEKHVGMRGTNLAAAADTRATVARIQDELSSLFERTGTRAFAFLSRGHSDDADMPVAAEAGGGLSFCVETFGMPALRILTLFELWSCSRKPENVARDTRKSLCREISLLVEGKLRNLIKNNGVKMEYVNYEVAIQEAWRVQIEGYPADIDFVCPAQIKQIELLRRLRDGWRDRDIQWVTMTEDEIEELAGDLAERRASNNGVLRSRKRRSDRGGVHNRKGKGRARSDDDEPEEGEEDTGDDDDSGPTAPNGPHLRLPASVPFSRIAPAGGSTPAAAASPTALASIALARTASTAGTVSTRGAAAHHTMLGDVSEAMQPLWGTPLLPRATAQLGASALLLGAAAQPLGGGVLVPGAATQLEGSALPLGGGCQGASMNPAYMDPAYFDDFDFDNIDWDNAPPFVDNTPTLPFDPFATNPPIFPGNDAATFSNGSNNAAINTDLPTTLFPASAAVEAAPPQGHQPAGHTAASTACVPQLASTTAFIAYTAPGAGVLVDHTNGPRKEKRKASDPEEGAAPKKKRKPRSDLGTTRPPRIGAVAARLPRPAPKPKAKAGARTLPAASRAHGTGAREDDTTKRVKDQMAARAVAARTSAMLAAQMPPHAH
ncbi:hypothetical protein B0H15DRAFT_807475 [Mycena belliarum]|uniref:Uncharacterized protein n=1 Tax=Mycena belliarum TaxID=1033014 RepID=A0AAD6TM74_9AGAR|nr:hypothetical protein B0H15DRAFT_958387 [Mycena belliae]KAJ7067712.1 hypothetical protein B0H15DRAFT_807475 [Mycena belliae]